MSMTRFIVATLNICSIRYHWHERKRLVVAALLDASPDLVSLQEIHPLSGQGRWLAGQLNSRLGSSASPYHLIRKRRRHLIRGLVDGIAILTRLPILSQDTLSLGYGGRVALRVNLALSSGHTLDFVTTHLHPVPHDKEAREEQVMGLMGWLEETGHVPYQVIAGNFNELPGEPAIQRMKQGYRSVFDVAHGREPLATYPTALVNTTEPVGRCLDYIFVSSNISVIGARLFCSRSAPEDPKLYPSDHVGILATVAVRES